MAEALYRKYRPQVFGDVVGQEHIERTLKNAIEQDKVSHAYLFCGPRGTGKTTMARLLAKALLCEKGPTSEPDGNCRECQEIAEGVHPDVYELDAASRTGVENVREEIIGRVNFAPTRGKAKIYIIDEVHMLSIAAFNALLKTLEEPPAHVVFILCTTDPQKVPETIHSRCQRFDFHRLSNEEIVSRLGAVCVAENVEFEGEALDLIAHRADGGMRNALTALEQLIAFGEGKVTVAGAEDLLGSLDSSDLAEIMAAVGVRDAAACFSWVASYVETGADLAQFTRDMAQQVRNLYVMSLAGTDAALDVTDAERRELASELKLFGLNRLTHLLSILGELSSELRTASNQRLAFEIALTRMIRPESDLTLEALAARIETLEEQLAQSKQPAQSTPSQREAVARPKGIAEVPVQASAHVPPVGASQPAQPVPAVVPQSPAATSVAAANPSTPAVSQTSVPAQGAVQASTPASQSSVTTATQSPTPATQSNSPAVQPTASVETTAGETAEIISNPAALQRAWRQVVSIVKREKVSYGVLLVNASVQVQTGGQGVAILFPADNPLAFSMAQKPEVKEVLEGAFRQAIGKDIPLALKQKPSSTTQGAASGEPLQRSPLDSSANATSSVESAPSVPLSTSASVGSRSMQQESTTPPLSPIQAAAAAARARAREAAATAAKGTAGEAAASPSTVQPAKSAELITSASMVAQPTERTAPAPTSAQPAESATVLPQSTESTASATAQISSVSNAADQEADASTVPPAPTTFAEHAQRALAEAQRRAQGLPPSAAFTRETVAAADMPRTSPNTVSNAASDTASSKTARTASQLSAANSGVHQQESSSPDQGRSGNQQQSHSDVAAPQSLQNGTPQQPSEDESSQQSSAGQADKLSKMLSDTMGLSIAFEEVDE
ncbi:DNA polymerase III subunit gamma/tau [Cryptobacterium curtum]|uniref:DNA polymerase III subunit gamma/tau n=1 Tax=Cryptobacterium curtum TaxID=84163 RepID=UPI00248EE657|nr:DNA polymerase III subunit gamma/tau [Cryptobacterium curtum]